MIVYYNLSDNYELLDNSKDFYEFNKFVLNYTTLLPG